MYLSDYSSCNLTCIGCKTLNLLSLSTPKQVVPYNNLYYYYELYKSQLSFNSKDLVGYVLDHMKKHLVKQNQTFLDIGCGCGSISVSLLKEFDKV